MRSKHPELFFTVEDDVAYLSGTFILTQEGRVVDRYEIEVRFPDDFPDDVPVVYEVGGRIPRGSSHWHVEGDGKCCLFVEEEFWREHPDGYTLLEFLDGPVKTFFVNNTHQERTGEPCFETRRHHQQGLFDFYKELLQTNDSREVFRYVDVLRRERLSASQRCPCGSGRKLKDCHQDWVEELRETIPPASAQRTWKRFKNARGLGVLIRTRWDR